MNRLINVIENLLFEEESCVLDFKSAQYPLSGASEEDKSELVKDVVSFANAWRRSDAYILIGVKEVKGGVKEVCGVDSAIDDAHVQQLVNSKTNSPVDFSVHNIPFRDKMVTVIEIPVQKRPIYLKRDFGKLKRDTVYIRRGSSTFQASIDEISKMGIHGDVVVGTVSPKLKLLFLDKDRSVVERLSVPAVGKAEREVVIEALLSYQPESHDVEIVASHRHVLDEIRDVNPDGTEFYPYSTESFFKKLDKLNELIELYRNAPGRFDERVGLYERSLELSTSSFSKTPLKHKYEDRVAFVRIDNYGTLPSDDMIVYIYGNERVAFKPFRELLDYSVGVEAYEFKVIRNIVDMAKGIEKAGAPSIVTRYEQYSGMKPSLFSGLGIRSALPYVKKPVTWSVDANVLTVKCGTRLMHNHVLDLNLSGVYLCPMLKVGECCNIRYEIHSGNLPKPTTGELVVQGQFEQSEQ